MSHCSTVASSAQTAPLPLRVARSVTVKSRLEGNLDRLETQPDGSDGGAAESNACRNGHGPAWPYRPAGLANRRPATNPGRNAAVICMVTTLFEMDSRASHLSVCTTVRVDFLRTKR